MLSENLELNLYSTMLEVKMSKYRYLIALQMNRN